MPKELAENVKFVFKKLRHYNSQEMSSLCSLVPLHLLETSAHVSIIIVLQVYLG